MKRTIGKFAATLFAASMAAGLANAGQSIEGVTAEDFNEAHGSASQCIINQRGWQGMASGGSYEANIVVSEGVYSVRDCFTLLSGLVEHGYINPSTSNSRPTAQANVFALSGVAVVDSFSCEALQRIINPDRTVLESAEYEVFLSCDR